MTQEHPHPLSDEDTSERLYQPADLESYTDARLRPAPPHGDPLTDALGERAPDHHRAPTHVREEPSAAAAPAPEPTEGPAPGPATPASPRCRAS